VRRAPRSARGLGAAALLGAVLLAACGCSSSAPEAPASAPSPVAPAPTGVATPADPPEPTTTNTLPPPPRPSGPAPTTAGPLSAASLPVPDGWRTVEPPGNDEIGQEGNGSWVQALDPRYAAQGAVSVGCAEVTRDDYADPTAALEGGFESRSGDPGVGLALEFGSEGDAATFWRVYVTGVRACEGGTDGVRTAGIREPGVAGGAGLVDRRTDEQQEPSDWTEVGALQGRRVVLLNLGDPGHRLGDAAADALIARIPS
jgi:hypothetical protein